VEIVDKSILETELGSLFVVVALDSTFGLAFVLLVLLMAEDVEMFDCCICTSRD
jgi:hypothetical protein